MDYKFNQYQTPITDELLNSLPREVRNDLLETLESIKFVQWLISPEEVRGYAKNLKRWNNPNLIDERTENPKGRIYVELTKPHILEDIDFFRERAIFFLKHGKYTDIPVNPNPKSAYAEFWREEVKRWKDGLIRESDGEWITGYHYFYLNYVYMWINEEDDVGLTNTKKRKVRGTRKREFPGFWLGDYLWFHYMEQARDNAQHCKLLKRRGCGFSWKFGGITPCTMYTQPGLPNFHLASDKAYLTGDKGVFGKVVDVLDWIATNTPLPKLRLIDQPLDKTLGYKDPTDGTRKGILSSVSGISLKDDPDKARGLRGPIVQYEEDGVFDNLEDAWNVNLEATEDGGVVFGTQIAGGTGGTEGANFEGSEKLFYHPEAYSIYGIPNVFDKNANGESLCGFFWGAYLNRARYTHKINGECDIIGSLIEVLMARFNIKNNAKDAKALTQKKAEQPITPQDAIMRTEGSIFPVADLKDYLSEILPSVKRFTDAHYIGAFNIDGTGEAKFNSIEEAYPIRDFPALDNKIGAAEVFELPKKVKDERYIVGVDTYDDDEVKYSTSLGSIFVFDTWTRRIVAEYTGRPNTADAFYEIVYRMAKFYNAKIMYENNKKGLFNYFANVRKELNMLADSPEFLSNKQNTRVTTMNNTTKGVNATTEVNILTRRLQADWMVENAYVEDHVFDEEGNDITPKVPNYRKIRSICYLKEAIAWNSDINCDRISAMGMVMIYASELQKFEIGAKKEKVKTLADDPFFNKHYRGKRLMGSYPIN